MEQSKGGRGRRGGLLIINVTICSLFRQEVFAVHEKIPFQTRNKRSSHETSSFSHILYSSNPAKTSEHYSADNEHT
jgi:hypothetical protein